MRVLTYNVHGWLTSAGEPNVQLLAAAIAETGADMVGLNEVFHPYPTGDGHALAVLAQRLGMHYAFGATRPRTSAPDDIPYGNAFLTRWPILAYAAHHLAPLTSYGQRGLLEVRVRLPSGAPFTTYVIHLDHRSEQIRLEQWEAAQTWLLRDRARPHLLMGDFNALAATDYAAPGALDRLVAYQDAQGWPVARFDLVAQVGKAGYRDAYDLAGSGESPTWPAAAPERRIDYVFVPGVWAAALTACRRWEGAAAAAASDHLPVLAEFSL